MSQDDFLSAIFSDDSFFAPGSDRATMWGLILHGRNLSQIVRCIAEFSLADHLASGPKTAGEIATAERLDPDATHRLLRACVAHGLMRREPGGRFAETALLTTLRGDDEGGLKDMALTQGGPGHWSPVGRMPDAIRTGRPQAEAALGKDIWGYMLSDGAPELAAFMRGLGRMNAGFATDVVRTLDTRGVERAVDVGGANGSVLLALMAADPELKGVVFDLPAAEAEAVKAAEAAGLRGRLEFIGGNFLDEAPPGDLFILKNVLHNWRDPDCLRILKACRRAARPGTRLIVMEMPIDEDAPSPHATSVDLLMLSLNGAKERTLAEYGELLSASGFRLGDVTKTSTPTCLLHAQAV